MVFKLKPDRRLWPLAPKKLSTKQGDDAAKDAARWANRQAFRTPDPAIVRELLEGRERGDDLRLYVERITSQHGEDGIVYEILRRIGFPTRKSVEIGCGHNGGNSGVLPLLGYRSLMMDGSDGLTSIARDAFAGFDVSVVTAWVLPESLPALLADQGFTGDIDHLGVDLDGIDYWVLSAALQVVSPALIVAEYNQFWGGEVSVTVPYIKDFSRNSRVEGRRAWPKGYYGVSLAGLVALGERTGYRLVASHGGNAFLLREGLATELPTITAREGFEMKDKGAAPDLAAAIIDAGPVEWFAQQGFELVPV